MTIRSNSLHARDIASLVHPQSNVRKHMEAGPRIVAKGEGIHIYDETGAKFIEGAAGLWCASLGFGVERLAKVAYEQMRDIGYYQILPVSIECACHRAGGQAARVGAGANVEGAVPMFRLRGE